MTRTRASGDFARRPSLVLVGVVVEELVVLEVEPVEA